MLGDRQDICGRLRAVLPSRWFSSDSPNLNALLNCIATSWTWLFSLISYVTAQARLQNATDQWLDLISGDFFGGSLRRRSGELDLSYRARIQWALVEQAATRSAVSSNIYHLTGFRPEIFEPTNCGDTGSYASGGQGASLTFVGSAYGIIGGWGSLRLPFQFFIKTRLPLIEGFSSIAGYSTGYGGYGVGAITYIDLGLLGGSVTAGDIRQSLVATLPAATTAWLQIS